MSRGSRRRARVARIGADRLACSREGERVDTEQAARPWRPTLPLPKPNDSMTFVRQPVRDATEATLTVQHAVWNVAKGTLEWRTDRIYRWNR